MFFLLSIQFVTAQEDKQISLDTLISQHGEVVLFLDGTWEYVQDPNFDGILNPYLDSIVNTDSSFMFRNHWYTEMPYSLDNDLSSMEDSLWLCLIDSNHNEFCMPIDGTLTSGFKYRGSRFHYGVDLDLNVGDTVRAAFDGRVRYAKYNKRGYGNLVIIRHYNGLETYYAHLSKLMTTTNQEVKAGQVIGLGGKTGRAYGAHLHFECRFYDNALDPEKIFDFEHGDLQDCNLIVNQQLFDYKAVNGRYKIAEIRKSDNQPSNSSSAKYYKIRSGDSLWKISQRYGTSVDRLCQLNGISRNSTLHIGQVIRIRE